MNRTMRRVLATTAIALALGSVLAWNEPGIGGSGAGGVPAHDDHFERLLELGRGSEVVARDLAKLHAAVAAFADVDQAVAAGYGPSSECMSGEDGAQGIHYANDALFEPTVTLETPQLLMYEPLADGSLRFVGVEYLVFQQAWHDAGHVARPALLGRVFDLNETLLDEPFYLLHVWVRQFNPSGTFANWNPLVDCGHAAAAP
jgi:hypothetical protein